MTRRDPNFVDVHVGSRIRMRRQLIGMSQEKLGELLGITFQQVQKYERAANRVSASKLYEMARALETSTAYFFEGLADTATIGADGSPGGQAHLQAFLLTPEGVELASAFPRITPPRVRRRILDLVRAMVEEDPSILDD